MNKAQFYLTCCFFLYVFPLLAQEKPLSPLETIETRLDGVKTTIVYCRPSARGRVMIGGKEPFGQVWRTGANAATTIEFDEDVLVQGNAIPKGKYGLFTIPNQTEWTVILNKVHEQWGAYNYNQDEDILRFKVKVERPKAFVETFTITAVKRTVQLAWENYLVRFSVREQ